MVKWDFWTGFEINDTWSIAYYMKQKALISEKTALIILGIIGVIGLVDYFMAEKERFINKFLFTNI